MDLMSIRRRLLMMAAAVRRVLHTITSATGIVSFSTALAEPVESLVCEFSPVQPGSGDPSPDNIRPITGWTGLTVGHAAFSRKLIPTSSDTHWEQNGIIVDYIGVGTYWVHGTATAGVSILFPVESFTIPSSDGRVFEMHNSVANTNVTLVLRTASNSSIDSWVANPANRVSTGYSAMKGKTVGIAGFTVVASKTVDLIIAPIFAEAKQTDIPISWQSAAGTVYGGTLNVTTGVLTVTKGFATYNGSESWSGNPGTSGMYTANNNVERLSDYKGSIVSNIFVTGTHSSNPGTRPCVTAYPKNSSYNGKNWIYILAPSGTTAADIKAILAETPMTVVYPLATPQTYQLTPEEVATLKGSNTIWHDGNGSITLGYYDKT